MASRGRSFVSAHYGWVNVVLASLAMTATLPGRSHGLGLITSPLLRDLEIANPVFDWMNFWAVILGACLAWPVNWLIDRLGTRIVTATVLAGLGASAIWMSHATRETLFVALVLVRGLGQGALSTAAIAIVGKWYDRKNGPAMGAFALLLSIASVIAFMMAGNAVKELGWRAVWQQVGIAVLALAPLTLLLVRSLPSGEPMLEKTPADRANDATLGQALSSPAFWVFSLAAAFFNLVWASVTLYSESLLEEHGLGHDTFTTVMSILAGIGLVTNLLGGWLATRWPLGRLLGISMLLLAIALGAFPLIRTESAAIVYAVGLGGSGGLITVIFFTFYGQAYGRSRLGQIQGSAQVLTVVGSALGPVVLTFSKSATGSNRAFFWIAAGTFILLGLVGWLVRMPRASRETG